MGLIQRGVIAMRLIVAAGVVFLVFSRGVLPIMSNDPGGPATAALDLIPVAMQIGLAVLLLGAVVYLLFGIGQERTRTRRRP